MILYGNSDKIVTNWGEKCGELSDLVIILAMQISLYLVKTWVEILSLFFFFWGGICRNWFKLR